MRASTFILCLSFLVGACNAAPPSEESRGRATQQSSSAEARPPPQPEATDTNQASEPAALDCDDRARPFVRQKLPAEFFARRSRALWVPSSARRCIYVIPPAGSPRAIWQAPVGERLVRLGWAPDGASFAATTAAGARSRTYIVNSNGTVRERLQADGVAFLADGRQVIVRPGGLFLRATTGEQLVVTLNALRAKAGLGRGALVSVAPDRHGFARGYGSNALVANVFAGPQATAARVVLIVSLDGEVRRVGPVFGGNSSGVPGGQAWSPARDRLSQVVGELPGNARLALGHDHCVDVWTPQAGYRRIACGSQLPQRGHFDRLIWSASGASILLNNGVVINASGQHIRRLAVPPLAFQLQWTQ